MNKAPLIGVVIIGRNEGERLAACLRSIPETISKMVYVDSGSTDSSVELSRQANASVVELDMSQPFTAARARNEGFDALIETSSVDYVQFIDGDCTFHQDWIVTAAAFLEEKPEVAVVCGRRRERFSEASVYNRLCDHEWATPIGPTKTCGGDAMMRCSALSKEGGFNPTLIAGEEPELCVRLRSEGWKIWRLDCEMVLHDAAMTRFSQWWKRSKRGGHASAEGAAMHGAPPERHGVDQTRRALLWGCVLPLVILGFTLITPWALLLLGIYPLQTLRLAMREGIRTQVGWERAFFLTLGKFPEAIGALSYYANRILKRKATIIEYK